MFTANVTEEYGGYDYFPTIITHKGNVVELVSLFFMVEYNHFVDHDGYPVYDIFTKITPNDLYLFKYYKELQLIHNLDYDILYELNYPLFERDYIEGEF